MRLPPDPDQFFDLSFASNNNQHIPAFQQLQTLLTTRYKVRAKFEYMGYNGHSIYANGQKLVSRPNKFQRIVMGENVTLGPHNLTAQGGSNHYPSVNHKTAHCELEFITVGLPQVDKQNGWLMRVISLTPLN